MRSPARYMCWWWRGEDKDCVLEGAFPDPISFDSASRHAAPVHNARFPSVSGLKQDSCAVLGSSPSLRSIRAAHDGLALGKETVSDRQRKARYHGLLPTIQRPTLWQLGYSLPPVPLPRVVAKSAPLHFRLTAKIAFASLLLLSPPNPLCWASVGAPLEPPAAHGKAPSSGVC